jgi:ethanolamine utilization protein EutN
MKRPQFEGASLLLVQPETPAGESRAAHAAGDRFGGRRRHERVLVVLEGRAAGEALGKKLAPVDAAIIGIVDEVDVEDQADEPRRVMTDDEIRPW